MCIRESKSSDVNSIRLLHENAFGEPEGKVIAQLVCDLFDDKSAIPLLSLVVEYNDNIVGHLILSPVTIDGNKEISTYILAPLAISKGSQRKGLGTKLINYGLDVLKRRGVDIVFVLGDPKYYKRFGFDAGHNIKPPYELEYPEAWMAMELKPSMLNGIEGIARCASSLSSPEYW